ncbi:EI24 domain-containing protein [Pseudodonghicola xiamenensis]|uniref:Membrane protein n=1 Tax=Pseudodonghicola xiamenensis TaxID=337702 RepID=A0A8J3HCL1_9RHOB|nr:EI24 domain-containing protein [Pseudodonghicola xiamenensis]GHH01618.1 membrane protein [Pseudodonghicola xiamenensis]
MIFQSFLLALQQTGDPKFRKVLFLGIGLTFALLVAAYAVVLWLVNGLVGDQVTLPLIGQVTWLNDLLSAGSFFLMMILSVFLMVPVASAITSMFLDEVAQAVEDKHYPTLPPVPGVSFWDGLKDSVNFMGVLIAANTLALIIYALIPPASVFIFWALNGFLLGREYFMLAAMRRIGREGAKQMRARYSGTIWAAGTLMAVPLSVPLLNLVIPILGAATFTHIFHRLAERAPRS